MATVYFGAKGIKYPYVFTEIQQRAMDAIF